MWEQRYEQAVRDIIRYSALGYERMLVTAAGGNVSVRHGDKILVTRSGVSLREVGEADILLVDLDGNVLVKHGEFKPSKESGFHLAIYRTRPSVRAVYHVHPPHVTAFTVEGGAFPRVTSAAKNKLCPAPLIEPLRSGSRELLERVAETVRENDEKTQALILSGHGIVSFGETLEDCFQTAELMEDSARIAYMASQIRAASVVSSGAAGV
ncbi:MAG: class II aldolase/adducin family protein [Deltaproteobacteria bacterium]|nr:class II aldolase/adducin family protein [Deltaproteobacteria bacterium]